MWPVILCFLCIIWLLVPVKSIAWKVLSPKWCMTKWCVKRDIKLYLLTHYPVTSLLNTALGFICSICSFYVIYVCLLFSTICKCGPLSTMTAKVDCNMTLSATFRLKDKHISLLLQTACNISFVTPWTKLRLHLPFTD